MADDDRATKRARAELIRALEASGYVLSEAAHRLGISRDTVRRRLERWPDLGEVALARNPARASYLRTRAHGRLVSRQAECQARRRALGLCACGAKPAPKANGRPGRSCADCRTARNARNARRRGAAERA